MLTMVIHSTLDRQSIRRARRQNIKHASRVLIDPLIRLINLRIAARRTRLPLAFRRAANPHIAQGDDVMLDFVAVKWSVRMARQ